MAAEPAPADAMAQRVARAQQFISQNLLAKVRNNSIAFHWIGGSDRFWFRKSLSGGEAAFVVVDAATGRQGPLFDSNRMQAALAEAGAQGRPVIVGADLAVDGASIRVKLPRSDAKCSWPEAPGRCNVPTDTYDCDMPVTTCRIVPDPKMAVILSPDWKRAAFVRDHNVWVRDLASGAERQLTTAGVAHFAYGETHNQFGYNDRIARRRAGQPEPIRGLLWSPDGRYIVSIRDDLRAVAVRTVMTEFLPPEGGSPITYTERLSIASDTKYPDSMVEVIDVAAGTVRQTNVDPQAFSGNSAAYYFARGMVLWSRDNGSVSIMGIWRGTQDERLIRIDLQTGQARDLIVETAGNMLTTYRNPVTGLTARVLASGKQAVWFSERDGWGHFYLYDLTNGRVVRQITKGAWTVVDLVRVDEESRTLYFTAVGREKGRNPYYRHLYRISLDGGKPQLLTPENADHNFGEDIAYNASSMGGGMSPSGRYFIDCYSTISQPDQVVIRKADGTLVADVIKGDISELLATGWQPPEQFIVKAADGKTDLYGVMFKPINFDPTKKYPVIEITYPPTGFKFTPTSFWETLKGETTYNAQAFAELGAIVVGFDGRGGGLRSLAFRNAFLGTDDWMGSVDHVAVIRNLAAKHAYIDVDRVGLTGHSYGGYASLRAMLLNPGFFKVVVSGEGPGRLINNTQEITTERLFGIPSDAKTKDYYRRVSNTSLADRLADKLLLIYAGADESVSLRGASEIILSLQKANKDFDTLFLPDSPHYGGREPYGMRWTLRYFGENLGGPK